MQIITQQYIDGRFQAGFAEVLALIEGEKRKCES